MMIRRNRRAAGMLIMVVLLVVGGVDVVPILVDGAGLDGVDEVEPVVGEEVGVWLGPADDDDLGVWPG